MYIKTFLLYTHIDVKVKTT